jgi:vitamin B12 transporter
MRKLACYSKEIASALFVFFYFFNAAYSQTVDVVSSVAPINPIIVTATRTPKPGSDVLADYTYISREEIAQAGQSSLPELLQQQRSIQISSFGGSGNTSSVYLRGAQNGQSLVLIDGVKLDSATGGAIWNSIPLALIDHIEIIYGPQSTIYGSDAMGGVVAIFTKKGGGATQFEASGGYGTYNTSISNALVSGSLGKEGATTYSLGISQENSAGFNTVATNNKYYSSFPSTATGYTRLGVNGSVSNIWSAGQEIGLKVFSSKNSNQYPYSYYDSNTSTSSATKPIQNNLLSMFTGFSKNQITNNWSSLIQVSSTTSTSQYLYNGGFNDKLETPTYDFLWQNNFKIGQDTFQLLAERKMQYLFENNSDYLTGGCASYPNCNISQLRTTNSVAGSYELKRGNNLATFALRNDDISGYGSKATGSAAYGYLFTPQTRANINYGTGFRAPAFNDLYYPGYGNVNLKPESNRNIEAGIHYETAKLGVHLTAYQNRIQNFIIPINCDNYICANAAYYSGSYPDNFSLVQIKGASLGIDGKIQDLSLKASVDAMSTVDQTTGLAVPYRANWVGNLLADYKINNLTVGTNVTVSGQRWGGVNSTSTANIYAMPGYAIFNLYANYQIDKQWNSFVRWNNVFDTQYQTSYGYNNIGSNIFVGLRYAMK